MHVVSSAQCRSKSAISDVFRRITKLQTARSGVYSKSTGLQGVLPADKPFSVTAQHHKLPVAENVCLQAEQVNFFTRQSISLLACTCHLQTCVVRDLVTLTSDLQTRLQVTRAAFVSTSGFLGLNVLELEIGMQQTDRRTWYKA